MVANKLTVDAIIKVLLKHTDQQTAKRIAREMYENVPGSKSVTNTFRLLVEKLEDEQ